ncbi:MAG TPA: VWA domain-containing protein [Streptosporangiaceae bacterium]|nr:VWA domain-containing protein [Streptosporangiaceae bacterium]
MAASSPPERTLTALVDELRRVGVGVSVGEHLDAARALASIPLADRDVVRASLQCALVKRAEQLDAFNLLFDLHFGGTGSTGPPPFAGLSAAELETALQLALRSGDPAALRLLAEEYVRRYSGLEPGAPVAGVFAMIAAAGAANLDAIRADLLAPAAAGSAGGPGDAGGGGGGGAGGSGSEPGSAAAIGERLARAEADRIIDRFRSELQAAIRRALVADRGPRAVSATMRVRLAQDVQIATASPAELDAVVAAIGPLAHRLSKILAQQEFRKRRLSVRRTLHLAMGTGGVPFRIGTESAPPPKPEIVVLADVSGSVATFSRFTLNLLIALDSRLSRLRAFSFVDGLADITELVSEARAAGRQLTQNEAARGAVRWTGSSDYGHVLREFASTYARQFTRRTVVLVVGDARTNYLDPAAAALADVSERVGKLYWLNPEPRRYWNTGDSVIDRYAPLCAQVRECATLRQIADFVQSLAVR